jgi:hypothetical protein
VCWRFAAESKLFLAFRTSPVIGPRLPVRIISLGSTCGRTNCGGSSEVHPASLTYWKRSRSVNGTSLRGIFYIRSLGDDFGRGGEGAHLGALVAVAQTVEAQLLVATEPAVVGLPADSVVATGLGDVAADLLGVADDRETVLCLPLKLLLGHKPSPRTHGEVAGSDGDA